MGFWSRLFAPAPPPAPRWSGFTDKARFQLFVAELRDQLAASSYPVGAEEIASGEIRLTDTNGILRPWDLRELAAACAREAPGKWPELIEMHVKSAVEGRPLPGTPQAPR